MIRLIIVNCPCCRYFVIGNWLVVSVNRSDYFVIILSKKAIIGS